MFFQRRPPNLSRFWASPRTVIMCRQPPEQDRTLSALCGRSYAEQYAALHLLKADVQTKTKFGGWKDSGFGRESTRYAMDSMSDIKFLVISIMDEAA